MSWMRRSSFSWAHMMGARLLKCGVMPKHIAFIMDGNRRYAKKMNVEKVEGHSKGFDKLAETLQWCLDLGVNEVTVYAFSIENFKRSEEEVNCLMSLSREKFRRLLEEREKLAEKGVRIRVIGDISLLPDDLVKLIQEVEEMTKDNDKAFLNVALSYTAREEMTRGANLVLKGLDSGALSESDVSLGLVSRCLYLPASKPPDLIIRTSGETRLSDFLLFQGSMSYLEFTDVLWPELSEWHFMWIVFKYQCAMRRLAPHLSSHPLDSPLSPNAVKFLSTVAS